MYSTKLFEQKFIDKTEKQSTKVLNNNNNNTSIIITLSFHRNDRKGIILIYET